MRYRVPFYYSPMHAGNAIMVRAGACAYQSTHLPLASMSVCMSSFSSFNIITCVSDTATKHTIYRDEDPRPRLSGSMVLHLGFIQVGPPLSAIYLLRSADAIDKYG